jgi:hypothetical protein
MNTVNFLAVKAMINSISVTEKTPCVQPSTKTHTWEMKRVHLMCNAFETYSSLRGFPPQAQSNEWLSFCHAYYTRTLVSILGATEVRVF